MNPCPRRIRPSDATYSRITVGTQDEMAVFREAWQDVMKDSVATKSVASGADKVAEHRWDTSSGSPSSEVSRCGPVGRGTRRPRGGCQKPYQL